MKPLLGRSTRAGFRGGLHASVAAPWILGCWTCRQAALDNQVHRALDWDPDDTLRSIDPGIAAQDLILAGEKRPQRLPRLGLEPGGWRLGCRRGRADRLSR